MKTNEAITALRALVRNGQEHTEAVGFAIGILQHYYDNELSKYGKITRLPDTTESFGYFVVHECDENGKTIRILADSDGNAVEFMPNSVVMERDLRPS